MTSQPARLNNRAAVDLALLVLRVTVGLVFIAHGSRKLFGAFEGPGLAQVVQMMGPIGYLVTIGEFFGGVGLVFGFLTRFSAASLIVIMIGAIQQVTGKGGFFLPTGFEFNFTLIGMLLALLITGPGRLAIGRLFAKSRVTRPLAFALE